MTESEPQQVKILPLLHELANRSLTLWPIPEGARAGLINLSENATYLVEGAGDFRAILRLHRENYHTKRAIDCELAWMEALRRDGGIIAPVVIPGHNGAAVQEGTIAGLPNPRFMVMFEFMDGEQPDESRDITGPFEQLGEIAAKAHLHVTGWRFPQPFERLVWDLDAVYGQNPTWGDWRDGPAIDSRIRAVLERVEARVRERLGAFGKSGDRYGLIHADMRLANLLIENGQTRLIDFDDCGFGWFMYDFAAGISFIEDDPNIPALREAWLCGYRKVRPLSAEDEREIYTFIMLRRMALLAWIGSHHDVPEARALAPDFARVSADLGENYLAGTN